MPIWQNLEPDKPVDTTACKDCGHRQINPRGRPYCANSGLPLTSRKLIEWCAPVAIGDPYVPRKLRLENDN